SSAFLAFYFLKEKDPGFLGSNMIVPVGTLIAIIIIRDIILTLVRSVQEIRGAEFKTSWISKSKTFAQMTYIFVVIGFIAFVNLAVNSETGRTLSGFLHSEANYYCLLLITLLTVVSGIAYLFESNNVKSETA